MNIIRNEQISALVDGELSGAELDGLLKAMAEPENQQDWETYHQIGEILNSDEGAISLSPEFNDKLKAQLASEPVYLPKRCACNLNWLGALAAMLAFALVAIPLLAGQRGVETAVPDYSDQLSAGSSGQLKHAVMNLNAEPAVSMNLSEQMLRDPEIDRYLTAHHRYANTIYSAVVYEPILEMTEVQAK